MASRHGTQQIAGARTWSLLAEAQGLHCIAAVRKTIRILVSLFSCGNQITKSPNFKLLEHDSLCMNFTVLMDSYVSVRFWQWEWEERYVQLYCTYLSLEDVQGKSIEATDNSLLDIESEAFDRPHSRKQKTRPASTEHVDVDRPAFPHPNLNLLQQYKWHKSAKMLQPVWQNWHKLMPTSFILQLKLYSV